MLVEVVHARGGVYYIARWAVFIAFAAADVADEDLTTMHAHARGQFELQRCVESAHRGSHLERSHAHVPPHRRLPPGRFPDREKAIPLELCDEAAVLFDGCKSRVEIAMHEVAERLRAHFLR